MTEEDDLLKAVGRVAIAAGRLEYWVYVVAMAAGLSDAPAYQVTRALKLARKSLDTNPPPWGTATVPEFDHWRDKVVRTLDRRNRVFHSRQVKRMANGAWERVHLQLRDGADVEVTTGILGGIVDDLHAIDAISIVRKLVPEVRPGVYMPVVEAAGYPPQPFIVCDPATGRYPEGPSAEELTAWRRSFPPAWEEWIAERSGAAEADE